MSRITDLVTQLAEPVVKEEGCELWNVEYLKEAGGWYLRVYIDRPGGVFIDDCERVSRRLDPVLDEKDIIPDSYTFEVCSAGADRILKRPSDFERFISSLIDIKLYKPFNGSKKHTGRLIAYDDAGLTAEINGETAILPHDIIAQVRLHIDF